MGEIWNWTPPTPLYENIMCEEGKDIMETIGFIGLGILGSPMAQNIQKAGYPMVVYDIREGATKTPTGAWGASGCFSRRSGPALAT